MIQQENQLSVVNKRVSDRGIIKGAMYIKGRTRSFEFRFRKFQYNETGRPTFHTSGLSFRPSSMEICVTGVDEPPGELFWKFCWSFFILVETFHQDQEKSPPEFASSTNLQMKCRK